MTRTPRDTAPESPGSARQRAGDVVSFAPGPEGAHKTRNRGEEPARAIMFSSAHEPAVAVYPDSDKIAVLTPGGTDSIMIHRRDGQVPYFDGEP